MKILEQRHSRAPIIGAIVGLLLAVVILGPALKSGFLLSYDLVFVPELAFSDRTLGVDGSVPRAVPNDAVVALLSTVLPGAWVQKFLLVLIFVALGSGLGLVLRHTPATIVATTLAAWNPWVAQRLEVGHWGFVLGYAALPWVIWAAQDCRRDAPYASAKLGLVMFLTALTGSTGAVLALIVLAGMLLGERPRQWRAFAWGLIITVLVSATWWWPFLRASSHSADPAGVSAFAAKADSPWGVIVSVATGGGNWNQASWYAERQSWLLVALAFLVVLAGIAALYYLAVPGDGLRGLFVAAVVSLVLATMSALPGGHQIVLFLVGNVPGAGLLRDSQKFAGPWVLAVAVGIGLLMTWLASRAAIRERGIGWLLVVVGVLLPTILLPSLAWGSRGSWQAVQYPQEVLDVAEQLDDAGLGSVAVFPWIQYRRFEWNHNRIVLDPWNRLTQKDVVVNDGLPLRDGWVAGEDPRAAEITRSLLMEEHLVPSLRNLGIRHVLILTDQPEQDISAERLLGAEFVQDSNGMQWWDLGPLKSEEKTRNWSAFLGWIAAGLAGLAIAAMALLSKRTRKM